jgi:hypothetical protein
MSLLVKERNTTHLLPQSLHGKTPSLSTISTATCCSMSCILKAINQHLSSTSLLPTLLSVKVPPIRETTVATTQDIATPTSLKVGGADVAEDRHRNIPFMDLVHPNDPSIKFVTNSDTRLPPAGSNSNKATRPILLQCMLTSFLLHLTQTPNGTMTPAPMFISLMSSPISTYMLRTILTMFKSE